MTPTEYTYRQAVKTMREKHLDLTAMGRAGLEKFPGESFTYEFHLFAEALKESTQWAEIFSISKTRYAATGAKNKHPEAEAGKVSIAKFLKLNPEVAKHVRSDEVSRRIREAVKIERKWFKQKAKKLSPEMVLHASKVRMTLIMRNLINGVRQDSFWLTLNEPGVLENVAYVEYFSAHLPTSRPTHIAMSGFLATPTWKGWHKCRPLTGFNCRCTCAIVTFDDARERGLLTKDGATKFVFRWPNSASRRNFENKTFPDPGWEGPKDTI